MEKIKSVLLSAIALIIIPGFIGNTTLTAQTWTSIDGGYGINTSTATFARIPSTAVFNGMLYCAWEEQNSSVDQVHFKSYNGSSWTAAGESGLSKLNSSSTNARNPKIVYYNGALYAAYEEYDASIYRIHAKRYNGSSWSLVENYSAGDGRTTINRGVTANATEVDLIVYNGYLYATWAEVATAGQYNIRVSQFDGTFWTSVDGGGTYGLNYNTSKLAHTPRFAVYNNQLYLTWVEDGGPSTTYQVRVRRYDGSSVWTFVDGNASAGLNYNSSKRALTPVMASYNNYLYLIWSEPYYETYYGYGDIDIIRVRKYDGSSWSFVDGGGSSTGWNLNILDPANNAECLVYNNLLYVTWNEADDVNFYEQVRCVQYNGSTKTFLDGGGVTSAINYNSSANAREPVLTNYLGNLYVLWQEDNSGDQIRAKKTLISPFVESVSVPSNGTYMTGQTLTFTVNYSKVVVISGGAPYIPITLNTGGTVNATYTGGSGTSSLTFSYTVASGNGDPDGISVGTAIAGATLQSQDAAPLTANLTLYNVASTAGVLVDAIGPAVTSVSSITPDGSYNSGDVITLTIAFSEAATVTPTPTLALNSGGTASYASGSGSNVLTFNYTVGSGHNSTDLDYTTTNSLSLSGGNIKDAIGNNATLTLPTVGGPNSLGGQKNIVIDNTAPGVTISSTASNPTNTSPIPVTIAFNESVTGFVVGDIVVANGTKGALIGGPAVYTIDITPSGSGAVTVNVAAGVAVDAAGNGNTVATQLSRTYDNIGPTVLSVSSSSADGVYKTGDVISITTTFSEAVIVDGTLTLALNSGGTASYVSGSSTTVLTFNYTVAGGNSIADLDYLTTGSLVLSSGTIRDEAGNSAVLTLPEVGGINSLGGQKNILIGIVPAVTTQSVTGISSATATGNGNITSLGYPNPIAYGVCWNTTGTPLVSGSKADNGAISSAGSFTASITGLASGTTFYVRAYVTNIVGTNYGNEVSFTTNGVITYNLNGGINNPSNTPTYIYGTGLTLSEPTRTSYSFGGWYDNETFTGSAITAISSTAKGDVILYARWDLITDIDLANSTGITIYPNPGRDVVFIKGAKGMIYVYDLNSHLVLTKQIDASSCINIGSLPDGMYLVKVNGKNYKLIKE